MSDQVVDAVTARAIQVDAARSCVLFAWIILKDQANYPGKFVARLATEHPTIYVMVADTLAEVQATLPIGLAHAARDNADPPEVVEIWLSS